MNCSGAGGSAAQVGTIARHHHRKSASLSSCFHAMYAKTNAFTLTLRSDKASGLPLILDETCLWGGQVSQMPAFLAQWR
ncbi:hypothetical protein IWQ52_003742 [Labrenzia sp. EL_159]|nr:hypothetical protein [Labrenzia sp. EL_162]MBG6196212.1 hypothetical protein [Labrenzia sp. EL_159]